ncbi:MAG: response regulator [Flavobacteriales bacterium]|nr:response regulator [Flavobacteriales bacterium]
MRKVLIIEDEAIISFGYRLQIERMGFEVIGVARSSDEAEALIALERPDLMIMDVYLKGPKTGLELAQEMRPGPDPWYWLAHDLKNRVGGVLEAVRLLHERHEGMDPAELSTFAERNLFQALREIESALDDLGVERGPGKIRKEPLDLTLLATETLADLRPRLLRKEQLMIAEVADGPACTGRPQLLRRVGTWPAHQRLQILRDGFRDPPFRHQGGGLGDPVRR